MRPKYLLATVIILAGCSTASTIQRVSDSKSGFEGAVFGGKLEAIDVDSSGREQYRIFHQAATGFVSISSIRQSAENRAEEFCQRNDKTYKALSEQTSQPPFILGNFPRIEIIFVCAEKVKSANTTTEDGRYKQLQTLKTLLDDGAITQTEYDKEKSKILNR